MDIAILRAPHVARTTPRTTSSSVLPADAPFIRAIHQMNAMGTRLAGASDTPPLVVYDWCDRAHELLRQAATQHPACIALWQESLLPFFLKSPFLRRCREKPRGYAGDYLTIQMMYDAAPAESDAFGRAVEAWAMQQPCPRAVRNRRQLVGTFLQRTCAAPALGTIVSFGCGPAAEVFDLAPMFSVDFTLVDIDADALDFVRHKANIAALSDRVTTLRANIIKMAIRGDDSIPSGRAGFYSLGVIDYFSDEVVVRLLDYMHGKLAFGGRVFLGNFRPDHANAALFEHGLAWPLKLRSAPDLQRLVQQSRFAGLPVTVGAEPEGVQFFVECQKAK